MPVKHHLSQSSNDPDVYRLLIPFYHSYDTLLTEDYTVQVTLPHGAKNIKVHTPFDVDEIDYNG